MLLALLLLVLGVLADDPHNSLAPNDLTLDADGFDRCSDFHGEFLFRINGSGQQIP